MKKTILILLTVLLIGCQKTPVKTGIKNAEPEVLEITEPVEYIETDHLKALMLLTNSETKVVDLDVLHKKLSDQLLKEVDLSIDIDIQSDLIENIIYDALHIWRVKIVENVLKEEQVYLNDDDFETLVARTSMTEAYQLMLSYETLFLKQQAK